MLLLAAARRLPRVFEAAMDGTWTTTPGRELTGKRLAIIGCGRIGAAVARIAAFGFGMRVTGCRRSLDDADSLRADFGIERLTTDFADAVDGADFVSLHIPSIPSTAHYLGSKRHRHAGSACMADQHRTGRCGGRDGHVMTRLHRGASLDVFEREPYVPADRARDLRALDNVVLTAYRQQHGGSEWPHGRTHAPKHRVCRGGKLAHNGFVES
ncbi:MAG: NAD(P)-dependent oxidoreductase [Bryobacteraceae bacterium]|nr:NAD(P)-dependent oxidoreductase [Bryobacteraceae bacterium]